MKQSKIESALETAANTASGFIVSWLAYRYVVMPHMQHIRNEALWVTALFTVLSLVRSYVWRRFFNAGLHAGVHVLLTKILLHKSSVKPTLTK